MNFFCAGITHHTDDLAAGCAANNGIVDQDYALAGEQTANGIQLELDAEVAHTLFRFDECASDVMVADQPKAERQQRFRRISSAAATPESGTGTTRSASTGDSLANWRPMASRLACTERPKTTLSGREK